MRIAQPKDTKALVAEAETIAEAIASTILVQRGDLYRLVAESLARRGQNATATYFDYLSQRSK